MSFHPVDDKKLYIYKIKKNGESGPLEAHCFLGLRLISFYIMHLKNKISGTVGGLFMKS